MKEKIKKIIKYLYKYLPDILFLIGVLILSYNLLKPTDLKERIFDKLTHVTEYKVLGTMLIAFATDIAIRRYLVKRSSE